MALGALQGLTEYLPVSSSGHLVLGGALLGLAGTDLTFTVVVHAGTLVATLAYYRHSVVGMVRDGLGGLRAWARGERLGTVLRDRGAARLLVLIAVGTLPTAVAGLFFGRFFERLFAGSFEQVLGSPPVAAGMLLVTAAFLLSSRFIRDGSLGIREMNGWHALAIGVVQGLAILPGISRSGATIVCALSLGLDRELAARYSFLLAVPATIGALILEGTGADLTVVDPAGLAIGFVSAALVGGGALALLIPVVRQGRLYLFSAYLVPAAVAALILL